MDQLLVTRIVEAALLASGQPLSLAQLRDLFPDDQPAPNGAIEAAIEHLQAGSVERGVELVEVASGFRFQVKADVHPWVARLWTDRQTRYTRATLETLALIAYRQPITRGEIEQVRGVSVSSNTIKALEEREWIRVVGHRDVPGRPALYGTTKGFLDYFGLKRLDELPPLSELKDIGELEPQLQFDQGSGAGQRIAAQAAVGMESEFTDGTTPVLPDVPESDTDIEGDHAFRTERPVVFDENEYNAYDETEGDADPGSVEPEAAPGMRAVTENDHEQVNAVATTTVPAMTTASDDVAESREND